MAVVQINMDNVLLQQMDDVYGKYGMSFSDAVNIFARKSLEMQGLPFSYQLKSDVSKRIGVAKGKLPKIEDIDQHNDEIANLFGV